MRAGHVIYGTYDLDKEVKKWRDQGFTVEYGTKKRPHNALVYFSSGPFIELLQIGPKAPGIKFFMLLMRLFRMRPALQRFEKIMNADQEGWLDFCIEQDAGDLRPSIKRLQALGFKGTYLRQSRRKDTKGRLLKFQNFFPDDLNLPFLMSYYTIDPKPKNYTHPNGVVGIDKIKLGTSKRCVDTLARLLEDPLVEVEEAESLKILDVHFSYQS